MTYNYKKLFLVCAITFSTLTLSSCTPFDVVTGKAPEVKSTNEVSQPPKVEELKYLPDGSAKDNLDYFNKKNIDFVNSGAELNGRSIFDNLVAAGFPKKDMQVSFDKTKTNLDADAIFVSVKIDEECLIGQIYRSNRTVYGDVSSVSGPDRVCLIGETRVIDW